MLKICCFNIFAKKKSVLKRVIVSVVNDLVTDQRVNKSCLTLQKLGCDVLLVGRRQRKSPPMDKRPYKTHRMRLLFEKGPFFYAEFNMRLFFFLLFHKADVLFSNDLDTSLPNYLVSRIKRIGMVYDSHEYFTETPELVNRPRVQRVWKGIEKLVVPKLGKMITVNESIANLFCDKYGVSVGVVRNIPNQIEITPSDRAQLGLPLDKHLLVLQGSGINVQRGAEELIEAMRLLDDCYLMVIGGGDVLDKLKQMVSDYGISDRVCFLPRMPYQEMMRYTQLAELGFCLDKATNLNYRYCLPNKLFDFIHAGVPVVAASCLVEVAEIILRYDIGLLVDDHNPQTIAAAIKEGVNNSELREKWKANLQEAASKLTWQNEEQQLISVLRHYV